MIESRESAHSPLPCLACGEEELLAVLRWNLPTEIIFILQCGNCSFSGPYSDTKDGAIAGWNKRPAHDALVQALKRIINNPRTQVSQENMGIIMEALKQAGEL